jgi:hypothetical protein
MNNPQPYVTVTVTLESHDGRPAETMRFRRARVETSTLLAEPKDDGPVSFLDEYRIPSTSPQPWTITVKPDGLSSPDPFAVWSIAAEHADPYAEIARLKAIIADRA